MANKMNILDDYRQTFSFPVRGKDINISLYYCENLFCFLMDLNYGGFFLRGTRVVNNYNLLGKYSNILPFGIQVYGVREPYFRDDFASGNNTFLILDEDELSEV
ncbi:hypothetical protein FACS1894152_1600 [Bacilli bacterium]|nr:hypothetical protein FACS1894152_1600 [Bacilli bacterium]